MTRISYHLRQTCDKSFPHLTLVASKMTEDNGKIVQNSSSRASELNPNYLTDRDSDKNVQLKTKYDTYEILKAITYYEAYPLPL